MTSSIIYLTRARLVFRPPRFFFEMVNLFWLSIQMQRSSSAFTYILITSFPYFRGDRSMRGGRLEQHEHAFRRIRS